MDGIAGKKDAAVVEAFGNQQMKFPTRDVQQFEVKIEASPIAYFLLEVRAFGERCVQGNFLPRALDDKGAGFPVGDIGMAAFANRDAFVEFFRYRSIIFL
jgi:hypothetical protein